MRTEHESSHAVTGFFYAAGAYLVWGLAPAFWKQVAHVPAITLISHRVIWCFTVVAVLLVGRGRVSEVVRVFRNLRALASMLASTALIGTNWFLFIWAVNHGHVMQASLGYYINPLMNVALARVLLGERLSRLQAIAIVLAAAGVFYLSLGLGVIPWMSLGLAGSFGLYGLVRKIAPVESLTGLAVETGLLAPLCLGYLLLSDRPLFNGSTHDTLFLLAGGLVTFFPLLWFAHGARRLRFSTLGIVQYLAPTGQLLLAVLVYGEPFTQRHAVTFALIWTAVGLYAWNGLRGRVRESSANKPAPAATASS